MSLFLSFTEKVLTGIGERPDFAFNQHFLFKISLAIIAGLLMGIEREYKGKDAGLKTNMLVAVASCAFVIMSLHFQGGGYIDLTRVLGQVVVGVGFLGAGVILKNHGRVKGLTTAATVWCSAAAGCMAALYMVTNLIIFIGAVLIVNVILGKFSKEID